MHDTNEDTRARGSRRLLPVLLRVSLVAALALLVVWAGAGASRHAVAGATLTVNSTGDASDASPGDGSCDDGGGNCTLRAAIEEANALSGSDTINFNITGGGSIQTISPPTALPLITDAVHIDGTTQGGGYAPIEIDGSGCAGCLAGLAVSASGSDISGLTINSFAGLGAGIAFVGPGGGNTIEHSYLGTNTTASGADGNGAGVFVGGSGGNSVGPGNVISGNSVGVWIKEYLGSGSTDNWVHDSLVGTSGDGTAAIPNSGAGVEIDGTGTQPVTGNLVGYSPSCGTCAIGIGGNGGAGVYIHGAMASGNSVGRARIGLILSPSVSVKPNGSHGVYVSGGAHDNTIGLPPGGVPGNLIAFNHGAGVAIDGGGTGNVVVGDLITSNDGLGIDLAPLGTVSPPFEEVLTSNLYCPAAAGGLCAPGGLLATTGYVHGATPNASYLPSGGLNSSCDPSGYGEAGTLVAPPGVGIVVPHVPPNGYLADANGDFSAAASNSSVGNVSAFYTAFDVTEVDGTGPNYTFSNTSELSNCKNIEIDSDGDGIQDSIDLQPATFSDDASDIPLGGGGTSFAKIIDRAGCYVSIVELPNPAGGVIGTICPSGGGPAKIEVCGLATITLQDGESTAGSCGSVHMRVDVGPVTQKFGAFTATLPSETFSTVVKLSPTSYSVNNDASSTSSITVDCTSIAPGDTVVFNDTDGDGLGDDVESNSGINAGPCDRGTNPNLSDTDGDGLQDGLEINGVATENAGTVMTNPNVSDTDGDGCNDGHEVGNSETAGGRRDPTNPNDYFNPSHDHQNRVDDILLVVHQYFIDSGHPGYNPDTDRTSLGPNAWNLGPPNGQQRIDDILNEVKQYYHDCS